MVSQNHSLQHCRLILPPADQPCFLAIATRKPSQAISACLTPSIVAMSSLTVLPIPAWCRWNTESMETACGAESPETCMQSILMLLKCKTVLTSDGRIHRVSSSQDRRFSDFKIGVCQNITTSHHYKNCNRFVIKWTAMCWQLFEVGIVNHCRPSRPSVRPSVC